LPDVGATDDGAEEVSGSESERQSGDSLTNTNLKDFSLTVWRNKQKIGVWKFQFGKRKGTIKSDVWASLHADKHYNC